MNCLKCGKEINDGQVFCANCLQAMEQYPVKPDAAIHLPNRVAKPVAKQRRSRRRRNKDAQLRHVRKVVRILIAVVILLTLLLATTAAALVVTLQQKDSNIGKNYTYEDSGE